MNKRKIKTKELRKLSIFYSYKQYFIEKNLTAFIMLTAFELLVWGFLLLLFCNCFFETVRHSYEFFIVAIFFKAIFLSLEKYEEFSIGYNLSLVYSLNNFDILRMRIFTRLTNIWEYFFYFSIVIYYLLKTNTPFQGILLLVLLAITITELLAFISYKISSNIITLGFIICYLLLVILFTFKKFINLKAILTFANTYYAYITVSVITIIFILLCKNKLFHKTNKYTCARRINLVSQLIRAQFKALLKFQIGNLIIIPFAFVVFLIVNGNDSFMRDLANYFIIADIASCYGINYFGAENELILAKLNSPLGRNIILEIPNIIFSLFCLLWNSVYFIMNYFINGPTSNPLLFFTTTIVLISILSISNTLYSLKNFYYENKKKKFLLKSLLYSICIFIASSIILNLLNSIDNQIVLLAVSFIIFVISCIIHFVYINNYKSQSLIKENDYIEAYYL